MREQHLDFLAIFESDSKFTELLLRTFDLLDKHCSVLFLVVCALFLRNKVYKNLSVRFEFRSQNWKQKKPIKFFVIVGGILFSYEQNVQ